jgi:hypothetical protein
MKEELVFDIAMAFDKNGIKIIPLGDEPELRFVVHHPSLGAASRTRALRGGSLPL